MSWMEESPLTSTLQKEYRHLRKAGNGRQSSPGNSTTIGWLYNTKFVSPQKKHLCNIIQTEKIAFTDLGICVYRCTHMYVITMQKETMNLNESEVYMGDLGGEKGRGKKCNYIIISKNNK